LMSQIEFRPKARTVGVPLFVLALILALIGGVVAPAFFPTSQSAVYWFTLLNWLAQSVEDLGLGFAALAILLILLSFFNSELKTFDLKVPLSRTFRVIGLVGGTSAMGVFAALGIANDISIGGGNLNLIGPLILRNLYVAHVIDLNHIPGIFNISVIGWNATVALSLSILFMAVYRLEQGILTAFWKSVTLFAAPAVMAFEIGLLLFGPSTMPLQATNFLIGTPLASVLTNWFLLVVSSGLFVLGLASRRALLE